MVPKPLPVPDLQETVDRTVHAARAVLGADDVRELQDLGRAFTEGPGELLQRRLLDFAHNESESGNSYLSREWLRSYLTTRTPLPLTTSVAFQLEGFPKAPGIERAADFLHRAAHVHLQQLRGQTPQEVDPRGHQLDMAQWQVLGPGIRHPLPDCDELRRPEVSPDQARIGLLLNGRLFTMPITKDDGAALPPSTITNALKQLLEATAGTNQDDAAAPQSFVDLSYVGSQAAAGLLKELLQDPANERVYQQLTEMLFVVDILYDPHRSARKSDVDRLRSLAFAPGHAWAYKPVSYQIDLHSEWIGIHFEHSGADGATVRAAVDRMQQLDVPAEDSGAAASSSYQELHWEMSGDFREKLRTLMAEYTEASADLLVHDVSVPAPDLSSLDVKSSQDAVQQLLLTYAQLATFGRVRSVYESVDMREFQAGRTECLRPVTPEAVACAQALLDGRATPELFGQTMDAHRGWVKACKAGRGIDRHLLGLQNMIQKGEQVPEFVTSDLREAVTSDFLSTTSLGEAEPICRYAFAPAAADSLGVGYVKYADHYEYVINHHAQQAEAVREFAQNIQQASRAVSDFIRQHARTP